MSMPECPNAQMPKCQPGIPASLHSGILAFWHSGILALLACMAASACAHPQAKTAPPPPPGLEVPPAPPRVVETTGVEIPQPVGLIEEPARNQLSRPLPTPAPAARPEPRSEPPKVEQPPVEAARPADEPPRQPPPATLQTTPSQRDAEVEGRIRALLARANADLNRIDYRTLGAGARTQYDAARSFIRQAEDALRERKLEFAASLADKAAVLAAQLAGR